MKKIIINSILLIVFLGLQLVINLVSLRLVSLESKLTVEMNDSFSEDIELLTGDITYLRAIMSLANNSKSKNDGVPISQRISEIFSQMNFIAPPKVIFFIPITIKQKLINFVHNNLKVVFQKTPSPPPKYLFNVVT